MADNELVKQPRWRGGRHAQVDRFQSIDRRVHRRTCSKIRALQKVTFFIIELPTQDVLTRSVALLTSIATRKTTYPRFRRPKNYPYQIPLFSQKQAYTSVGTRRINRRRTY